jgi:deoxyribodipyrimidine photo-lyase
MKSDFFDMRRVWNIRSGSLGRGPVVYWMHRDQRVKDNWALLYAQHRAKETGSHVVVVFCLVPSFLDATLRQYDFMLKGLQEVTDSLRKYSVPFVLLLGEPTKEIPEFVRKHKVQELVTDFSPLRIKQDWQREIAKSIAIPFHEVDTHNVVPCREVSAKQEFAAYTIRPKIKRLLPEFLTGFPKVKNQSFPELSYPAPDWQKTYKSLQADRSVGPIVSILPGEKTAMQVLGEFIKNHLNLYSSKRNIPTEDVQSGLSPYLHFGQISAQRIALALRENEPDDNTEAFLEELIVRKELSDNFCFYNQRYDSWEGFPKWARITLDRHRSDPRPYLYTQKNFEDAATHDDLWNAAQMEMVLTGKMHGYLRMYWAKKILEWTRVPEEAQATAIYLNDRYELDGRDPNGYAGIAWSIGGLHDRAWPEREVLGKIRYMSYNGCARKFDVSAYIKKIQKLAGEVTV